MAKVLRCSDLGADCAYVAKGKTIDKVLKKATEHAKKGHNIKKVTEEYLKSWRKHIYNEQI